MNARAATTTARHALGWLVAANAAGVLLAALLLWPELNGSLGPLTYGRWVPLHLDWQLYGWCALPLVGALGAWLIAPDDVRGTREFAWAMRAWTLALVLGGMSWLAGVTSGKLFLDWHGWARPLLPLAMAGLWLAVARAAARSWRNWSNVGRLARGAMLAGLLAVPGVLFWSMAREVYPSVNPDSGGATGAALLGSTLAFVALAGWLPHALGLARVREQPAVWFWVALAGSLGAFAGMDHGDASHHAVGQIVGLGVLLAWVPLLVVYLRGFVWPAPARRWLIAGAVWWALLVASGWWMFLPGESERWKFTHLLVAHAHLAMAGLVTCLGAAALVGLGRGPGGGRAAFWIWQLGLVAHLASLGGLAVGEGSDAAGFFGGATWVTVGLALRLASGVAMLGASIAWLKEETK